VGVNVVGGASNSVGGRIERIVVQNRRGDVIDGDNGDIVASSASLIMAKA